MQFFEVLFMMVTLIFLGSLCFSEEKEKGTKEVFSNWVDHFNCSFILGRSQVADGFSLFGFYYLLIIAIKINHFSSFHACFGFISGIILICTSGFYTLMMPVTKLPAPTGALSVGNTNFTVIDESRREIHTSNPNGYRELFVDVWYPALEAGTNNHKEPKSLWEELYRGEYDIVSFFMKYLHKVKKHSFSEAPPDDRNGLYPVILFNHGLQMFTSQSTLLIEHLVSHGYIVVSIGHPFESLRVTLPSKGVVLPPFLTSLKEFKAAMSWIKESSAPILAARDSIKKLDNPEERAMLILKTIKGSELNEMVSYWEMDNHFVFETILSSEHDKFIFSNIMELPESE